MWCRERERCRLDITSLVLVYEFLRRENPKSVPKGQFAFKRGKLPLERGKLTEAPGRFNRFGNCSIIFSSFFAFIHPSSRPPLAASSRSTTTYQQHVGLFIRRSSAACSGGGGEVGGKFVIVSSTLILCLFASRADGGKCGELFPHGAAEDVVGVRSLWMGW